MAELNKIHGIVVGQYGTPIALTLTDKNAVAIDISAYLTFSVTLRDPDDIKTLTYAAALVTDGTDGKVRFTPQLGDIDKPGTWMGQVTLNGTGLVDYTQLFKFMVERNLG